MAPPSPEEFAAQFRDLSPDERAAFVADLLSARGWQTDREGCRIVATADGQTRRVSVGSHPDTDVDEVVYVSSRFDRLVSVIPGHERPPAGRHSDVTLLDPADLHQRLLHAIDRERATVLYRDHFGAVFDPDESAPPAVPHRIAVLAVLTALLALATAALLAGALVGSSLPGQSADSGPATEPVADTVIGQQVDGAAAADPSPTPRPQTGLRPEDVRDIDRLALGHSRVLGDSPIRMRATFKGPRFLTGFDTRRSGYDPDDEVSIRVCAESDTRYRTVQRTAFEGPAHMGVNATFEQFADGTFEYRRVRRDGDVEYGLRPVVEARNGSATVRSLSRPLLFRYLNTTERQVTTIRDDSEPRYRLVATGEPLGLDHAVRDYRATAVVRSDGLVTDLRASYVHPDTEALVRVTAEHETSCEAAVPGWYHEARTDAREPP